jgi:hypothetical protein
MFVSNARAYPNEALYGRLLALLQNSKPGWRGLAWTNTLALLIKIVNYGRKKFYKIGPGLTDNRQRSFESF